MSTSLTGRRVVLTGASRGIGRAIALDLARSGAHLVLVARSAPGLESLAAEVRAAGGTAEVVGADVATAEGRARVVEAAGAVDALVNNAGVEHPIALVDQSVAQVDEQVAVNLLAPLHLTRALLPGMIARRRGAVVMVSSMSGKTATPYNAVYAATKHGLQGLCASLAIELDGTGVTVATVCPSFVADAGMWADTGLRAPALMREVPLPKVVAAVRRGMEQGGEILVTPAPVRPLLAIQAMFPALDRRVLRWMGVLDTLRARAERAAGR